MAASSPSVLPRPREFAGPKVPPGPAMVTSPAKPGLPCDRQLVLTPGRRSRQARRPRLSAALTSTRPRRSESGTNPRRRRRAHEHRGPPRCRGPRVPGCARSSIACIVAAFACQYAAISAVVCHAARQPLLAGASTAPRHLRSPGISADQQGRDLCTCGTCTHRRRISCPARRPPAPLPSPATLASATFQTRCPLLAVIGILAVDIHRAAATRVTYGLRRNGPMPLPRQPSGANRLAPSPVIRAKGADQSQQRTLRRLPDPQGGIW